MKQILVIVAIAIFAWFEWGNVSNTSGFPGELPPAPKARSSKGVRNIEFTTLLEANRPFSELAKNGYYTVVEVYLDSCKICQRLESHYPDFLHKRRDVLVRKVHFPERGLKFSFEGSTRQEIEREATAMNARVESYQVCGTPHIEVYDPDGQLLAGDVCGKKQGLAYLRRWIGTELSVSPGSI